MPNPRLVLAYCRSLTLFVLVLLSAYGVNQAHSQELPSSTTAEFAISALPFVSEEMPAISDNRVIWYDDRKGPTDVWAYDLTTNKTSALTRHKDAQLIADIHGDLVVYEDNRNGTWDIYARQLGGQEEFLVGGGANHQRYPRVWGDYIVYQDETAKYEESDVYLYQVSTGVTTRLAVVAGYQGRPAIDNNWVVWIDQRTGSTQLGIYNLITQTYDFHPLDCSIYDCSPRLSGDEVVWSDNRDRNANVYLYHLVTKLETALYTGPGDQTYPDISPELIVWQDQATYGNWNIFVYVRATQTLFPATTDPSRQIRPAVAGNTVVWQDNRNHTWDIYGFVWRGELPSGPTATMPNPRNLQVGAYAQGALHLSWEDASSDEQGFRIERAVGVFSTNWEELINLPANSTSYIDRATTVGQSYWYRVRATSAAGTSMFSNESYSTALDDVPSLDERYLHVLINELRMAPAAGPHSAYAPLDPVGWHPNLAYSARAHALGMNNSNCCQGHFDLAGRNSGERAAASGYTYGTAENLFQAHSGSTGMEEAHQVFSNSPGHLANMLDPNTRQLAIGFAPGGRGTLVEVFSRGPAGVTVSPLPSGIVVPYRGKVATDFDFLVSFANPAQEAPSEATVVIDGEAHPMTLRSGQPGRGTYLYRTRLRMGDHSYYFAFAWGSPRQTARLPEQGAFAGPAVHPPLPDLRVHDPTADKAQAVLGREWKMPVALVNHGENAANHVSIELYGDDPRLGGTPLATVALPAAIPPNGVRVVVLPWRPTQSGVQRLYVWVDSEEAVSELDETNNLTVIPVQVRAEPRVWYVNGSASSDGDGLTPESALPTINAALEQAGVGDFVQVAAGVYPGPLTLPAGIHLAGVGYSQTTLQGDGKGHVVRMGDQSTISGFTITGSGPGDWDAGVWIDADRVATVRNNRITGNSVGIMQACFGQICTHGSLLHNNLIDGQRRTGINIIRAQVLIVNNTVIDNAEWGIHVDGDGTVVKNNVIVGNKLIGLYNENGEITVDYNNLWNNGSDHQGITLGSGNLSVNPQWVAAERGDYRLGNTSPCLNAGDPDGQHLDLDGSRNDLGALGGPDAAVPLPTVTPPTTPTPPIPVGTPGVYLPLVRR